MKNCYKFFQNSECEYFPCHKIDDIDKFNCLFCFCPLYLLGKECGGNFEYSEKGIKKCQNCNLPHIEESGYRFVMDRLKEENRKTV